MSRGAMDPEGASRSSAEPSERGRPEAGGRYRLPRIPRGVILRFAVFLAIVLVAAALVRWTSLGDFLEREALVETLAALRDAWWAPLVLIGLYLVLCPIGLPATPLILAGGIVFGTLWGAFYSFVGSLAGGVAGFLLARLLGADFVHHLLGDNLRRIERMLDRQAFELLVGLRFLPIPFPLVNFAMAMAGVPLGRFTTSTAVGLAPAILVWTYFASALYRAAAGETAGILLRLGLALALMLLISTLPILVRRRLQRRAERSAARGASDRPR